MVRRLKVTITLFDLLRNGVCYFSLKKTIKQKWCRICYLNGLCVQAQVNSTQGIVEFNVRLTSYIPNVFEIYMLRIKLQNHCTHKLHARILDTEMKNMVTKLDISFSLIQNNTTYASQHQLFDISAVTTVFRIWLIIEFFCIFIACIKIHTFA